MGSVLFAVNGSPPLEIIMARGEREQYRDNSGNPESGQPDYVLQDQEGNEYWSIKDALQKTKLSRVRVQELVRQGRIEGVRPSGREWFISMDSLQEYEENRRRHGDPQPQSDHI